MHADFRNGERVNPKQENYEALVEQAFNACGTLINQYIDGAEADAGFDAGEFSGPANARAMAKALDKKAIEFGFPDYDHLESEAGRLGLFTDSQ